MKGEDIAPGTIPENEAATQNVEEDLVNEDMAQMGPAQEMQLEAYRDNATILIFDEKTQPAILQSLQSKETPVESVGETAFIIHKRMEQSLNQTGEKMTEVTMTLGAGHVVSELVVLAEAAGLYKLNPDERVEAFRHGLMKYFDAGLNDGSIDPVELQKTIEPLLTDEQREFGLQQMEQNGLSKTAPPSGQHVRKQPGQQPILGGGNGRL